MNQAKKSDHHKVHIHVSEPASHISLNNRIEKAVAKGKIQSDRDFKQKRREFIADQQNQVVKRLAPVVNHLSNIGGKLLSQCQNTFCLTAQVTPGEIEKLANFHSVARIDRTGLVQPNDIEGREVRDGTQIKQYMTSGYVGSGSYNAGVIEVDGLSADHPGFLDYSTGPSRIMEMDDCSSGNCNSVSSYSNPSDHPTAVSGLFVGDLQDNQDPSVTGSGGQKDRSGYSTESNLFFWKTGGGSSDLEKAMDDAISKDLEVLNISIGSDSSDSKCKGETSRSRTANTLYENGIFTTFAAGNEQHGSTSDCTVEGPGSAIGLFTVGAHTNSPSSDGEYDIRYGDIDADSSRGGNATEGKGRTIIDLTAAGCREQMFDNIDDYTYDACGTSFASPTTAAAALNFTHFYESNYGTGNIHPGAVTANMLLMGDRQGENNTKLDTTYSNLWGAGRLKMRQWNDGGMDAPWEWGSYSTCVDDGVIGR